MQALLDLLKWRECSTIYRFQVILQLCLVCNLKLFVKRQGSQSAALSFALMEPDLKQKGLRSAKEFVCTDGLKTWSRMTP